MNKIIYIFFLSVITLCLNAQFAAVLTRDGFIRLESDSALLIPAENLRGNFQWQKSTDSISWVDVESNVSGDTLAFVPEVTEAYRLQITEGTCLPLYSNTIKVFSKNTTVSEYRLAGISIHDLFAAGVLVSDLMATGVSISDLLAARISVADLIDAGLTINGLSGINTDQDNNEFEWIGIGEQIWMAENLKTTHYADGTGIPLVENTSGWDDLSYTDEAYCYYNDSSGNGNTYGTLYTWSAAMSACPIGWHLPSDAEWKQLEMYLGMSQSDADGTENRGTNEGSKLAGNSGLWNDGELEFDPAFAKSGFMALPGGYRGHNGTFNAIGNNAYFWSVTEVSDSNALNRYLRYTTSKVNRYSYYKGYGFSVRCTKD